MTPPNEFIVGKTYMLSPIEALNFNKEGKVFRKTDSADKGKLREYLYIGDWRKRWKN